MIIRTISVLHVKHAGPADASFLLFVSRQLAKDCEALKAQATSLLGELNERQILLQKSDDDRKMLEEK